MLISIGLIYLMLCVPLDWQYAELPSFCALCLYVRCGSSNQIKIQKYPQNFSVMKMKKNLGNKNVTKWDIYVPM